jgi:hypothetical protein
MSGIRRILLSLVVGLIIGFLVYVIGALILTWITFYLTPTVWLQWNTITLPFQYYIDWGYMNLWLRILTLVGVMFGFIVSILSSD